MSKYNPLNMILFLKPCIPEEAKINLLISTILPAVLEILYNLHTYKHYSMMDYFTHYILTLVLKYN